MGVPAKHRLRLGRYLNSMAAKYLFRADDVAKGEATAQRFTLDKVTGVSNLTDMQALWYEVESGMAHLRLGNLGMVCPCLYLCLRLYLCLCLCLCLCFCLCFCLCLCFCVCWWSIKGLGPGGPYESAKACVWGQPLESSMAHLRLGTLGMVRPWFWLSFWSRKVQDQE